MSVKWHITTENDYDEMGNKSEAIAVTNHSRWYRCYCRDDAEWLLKVLESTGEDINYEDLKKRLSAQIQNTPRSTDSYPPSKTAH